MDHSENDYSTDPITTEHTSDDGSSSYCPRTSCQCIPVTLSVLVWVSPISHFSKGRQNTSKCNDNKDRNNVINWKFKNVRPFLFNIEFDIEVNNVILFVWFFVDKSDPVLIPPVRSVGRNGQINLQTKW